MKPIAPDSHCIETTRDRQEPRHARQGVVKRGVKAGHLRQVRVTPLECFDQLNRARQMIGIVRTELAKFFQQCRRNTLGLSMLHAVDHAVTYGPDLREIDLLRQPVDQKIGCRSGASSVDGVAALLIPGRIAESQLSPGCADAVNFSCQDSKHGRAGLIQRKLDAGRAPVDREHAVFNRVHVPFSRHFFA